MVSALSSAFSSAFSADVRSQVGVAVARKTLDAAEAEGQAAIAMIRDAAAVGASSRKTGLKITPRPDLASTGRARISAQPTAGETGGRLDVTA
jgi:hypothetical protein